MQTPDLVKNLTLMRITLSFEGNDQHIGLFQGLPDALGQSIGDRLMRPFNERLPSPELDVDPSSITFWFTRDGIREFMPDLNYVLAQLHRRSWGYIVKTISFSGQPCFLDEFQAALSDRSVITPISLDFADTPYQFTQVVAARMGLEMPRRKT